VFFGALGLKRTGFNWASLAQASLFDQPASVLNRSTQTYNSIQVLINTNKP
jgi:hypothetical protein